MSKRILLAGLIRTAHANPDLRPHLLPLIKGAVHRTRGVSATSTMDEVEAAYDSPEWVKVRQAGEKYNRAVRDLTKALTVWIRKYPTLSVAREWKENMDSMFHEVFWM